MKKADVKKIAKEMAESTFRAIPAMDDMTLRNYLMTEETKAGIPWNGHTTFVNTYFKTYKALQQASRDNKGISK